MKNVQQLKHSGKFSPLLREYFWVDNVFAYFIEQMYSILFWNMLLRVLIKSAELKMLGFFGFFFWVRSGQNRGSGWWSHSCQKCKHFVVKGIGLLYMQACNHFKFYIWGFGGKSFLNGVRWEGKNTSWLCSFSPMFQGKTFLQRYWHTA